MKNSHNSPVRFRFLLVIVTTLVLGIGVTLLSGLVPALAASRVTPLEALRPVSGAVEVRRSISRQGIAGAVLILVAAAGFLISVLWERFKFYTPPDPAT